MLLFPLSLLAPAEPAATGRTAGRVTVGGLAPKLANLPVTRDIKICGTSKPDEALEVGAGGGVKNAVIWVADVPAPKKREKKHKLDQQGCLFIRTSSPCRWEPSSTWSTATRCCTTCAPRLGS